MWRESKFSFRTPSKDPKLYSDQQNRCRKFQTNHICFEGRIKRIVHWTWKLIDIINWCFSFENWTWRGKYWIQPYYCGSWGIWKIAPCLWKKWEKIWEWTLQFENSWVGRSSHISFFIWWRNWKHQWRNPWVWTKNPKFRKKKKWNQEKKEGSVRNHQPNYH